MNQWLTTRTFGMPRWAFISLLAGGVVLGLYLRSRRQAAKAMQTPAPVEGTDTLAGSDDPGLAGVGVVSPPGGVYPVSSPMIPEGLTDIFGSLTDVITSQGAALAEVPNAHDNQQPPVVNVTVPATGGGPPSAPPKKVPSRNVNVNPGSPRQGQTFKRVSAKGGEWHVYPNGKRVFVRK